MKRLKKELSLMLVAAIVISSIAMGFAQLNAVAASNATGNGIFRVDISIGSNDCTNGSRGTDSSFRLEFLDANNVVVSATPDNAINGGTTAGNGGTNPLENAATTSFTYNGAANGNVNETVPSLATLAVNKSITQVQLVCTSAVDDWAFNNVIIKYSYDGGSTWVDLANNGWSASSGTATWSIGSAFTSTYLRTLTFNPNGGSGGGTFDAIAGQTISAPSAATRTGYTFNSWGTVPARMPNAATTYTASWTPNQYTVTYDSQGGTPASTTSTVTYDSTYGAGTGGFPSPTKSGYTFGGWYTSPGGSGVKIESSTIVSILSSITLYAKWIPINYNITFIADGGSGGWGPTLMAYGSTLTPPTVTKSGYTFSYWSPTPPSTVGIGDATYSAVWSINSYWIYFDEAGGTTVPDKYQQFGSAVTAPANPTRTGWTFNGWDHDPCPTTIPARDTTCVAQWTHVQRTFTFNSGGGTLASGTATGQLFYGDTLNAPTFTRPGYTFNGWSTAVPSTMPDSDFATTALWTANKYYVRYNAHGGTGSMADSEHTYGVEQNLTSINYSNDGYSFAGWNTAEDGSGTAYTNGQPVNNLSTGALVTLYAQWTVNQYTISFDSKGGLAVNPIKQNFGTAVTAPANPSKEGYTFTGWDPAIPPVMPSHDTTCNAQWSPNTYTIEYRSNEGNGGSMDSSTHTYDTAKNLTKNNYTRTGYQFDGWNTAANGSGTDYANEQSVWKLSSTQGDTVVLYAQWVVNQYTISFNTAGGSAVNSITQNYNTTVTAPADPSKTGYVFSGWSPACPTAMPEGGAACIAQWTAATYTVTFNAQGGAVTPATSTVTYNSTYGAGTSGLPTPTRTGYTFGGWYTGTSSSGTSVISNTTVTITDNQTLFAKWTANTFKINYNGNGSTGGSMAYSLFTYDAPSYLTAIGFTKIGNTFKGWSTIDTATTATYAEQGNVFNLTAVPNDEINFYAVWEANSYTLTFNAGAGATVAPASKSVTYGSAYGTLPADPDVSKTGYTFDGWLSDNSGSGTSVTSSTVVSTPNDHSVYASWSAKTYTITFNAGTDGTVDPATKMVTFDSTYSAGVGGWPTPSKTGYGFDGWYTQQNGAGSKISSEDTVATASNQTLFANWTANTYTVTFNAGTGGTVDPASKTVAYGSTYGAGEGSWPIPSKTGYSFDGWYTQANGEGTKILAGDTVAITEPQNLYANWTVQSYTLTFNVENGGTVTPESKTVTYGSTYDAGEGGWPTPTKTGYDFEGWYTQAEGAGTKISASNTVAITANQTLYANWTAKTFTVTFDAGSGVTVDPASKLVTYGNIYGTGDSDWPAPSKAGYSFEGWYTQANGAGAKISTGDTVAITANQTLYANWTVNTYTVTFNSGIGGTVDPVSKTVVYDGTYGAGEGGWPTPSKAGYSFDGWYTQENGEGTKILADDTVSITSAQTVYAKWTVQTFTINFNAGTNGIVEPSSKSVTYGSTYGAGEGGWPTPSKTGYDFDGWYTQADGEGTKILAGDVVSITDTQTLYANWIVKTFTITFNAGNDGTVEPASKTVIYGSAYSAGTGGWPIPSKIGYNFDGWYTQENGAGTKILADDTVAITANQTLYANWIINTVTITFDANGGSGGTSGSMQVGSTLTPPTVTKEGYVFTGWLPEVPATVPSTNTEYKAQYLKTELSVTKLDTTMKVNIKGWVADYKYQIWSYQNVTSDIFSNETAKQWVLSKEYTLGSEGVLEGDNSISFFIDNFVSPDSSYTVAVRVVDASGNFVSELRDTFTSAEVQEVKITKVLVDGDYYKDKVIKEIKAEASTLIKVVGNGLANTTYTATVEKTSTQIPVSNTNEFVWNISALAPGTYTIKLTATNGSTADTKYISFNLFSVDESIQYGDIDSMALAADSGNINIDPDFTDGLFYYQIGEPGRTPLFTSEKFTQADTIDPHTMTPYGIYQVSGFVNRLGLDSTDNSYDDGIIKTISVKRSQTIPSYSTLTANVNLSEPIAKNTSVHFSSTASIGGIGETAVQYSFWRYDAKGYALVKDWSADNTLNWTPARVGMYTIEVRAKGIDAGSYETVKSVTVNVTDSVDRIAQGVNISINYADLVANAKARVPVVIKANATSTSGDDLLYKFYAYDSFMGYVTLQNYSADQNCLWTPRKPGTYTISVLVKNKVSFGKYDAIESYSITVK